MANSNPVQSGKWFGKGHWAAVRHHADHEHNAADYARPPVDYVDGDMTKSQVAQVLQDLDFRRRQSIPLHIDRDCRDYLLRALQRK